MTSRRIRILAEAAEEAVDAAAWYEEQQPGLGSEFKAAIDAALDMLESDLVPLLPVGSIAGTYGAKLLMLRRFPYSIVLAERSAELVVVAFAHQSRRPGYWRKRLRA